MHINPSTNTITATTFAGTASKSLADGLGNNIVNTYETKTDAAAKLTEAKEDAAAKLTEAKEYTDAAKTALLGGASEAHNTLDKLGDLIVANA
jgi:glucan phosphorylase